MREILFRGKSEKYGWIEGWFCPTTFGRFPPEDAIVPKKDAEEGYWHPEKVIPETVGQFTGLTDRNGKKIFEGDIVKFGDITGIINYSFGCYCVKTNKPDWRSRNNPAIDIVFNEYPNEVEVIGNIHDNPYLLKDDELECPLGGDETDDCADCPYAGDYHFVDGECLRRPEEE